MGLGKIFKGGSEKTTQKQEMPKWQEQFVRSNMAQAQALGDVNYTDRNLTAANNPALYGGLAGVEGLSGQLAGQNFGGNIQQGYDYLNRPDLYQAQFDQNAANAVRGNYNLDPSIAALGYARDSSIAGGLRQAGFAGGMSNNIGSAPALMKGAAIGQATGNYLSGVADLYRDMNNTAVNAGLGYGQGNAGMRMDAANNLINSSYQGLGLGSNIYGQQFGMGGTMTGLDQAGIDREVGRDMFNAMAPRETLAFKQGQAGSMGQYGGTTTTRTPTASPFQQALGAGVALGGAYLSGGGSFAGMFGGLGGGGGGTYPTMGAGYGFKQNYLA
jgi:hypothetical protein